MPAPAARPPLTQSTAAPGYVSLPAATPSTPREYLLTSPAGDGSSTRTPASSRIRTADDGSDRPTPTSSTLPQYDAPGSTKSPGFHAPNVTVTSARTATPATRPVDASTPLGTSTATRTPADESSSATR